MSRFIRRTTNKRTLVDLTSSFLYYCTFVLEEDDIYGVLKKTLPSRKSKAKENESKRGSSRQRITILKSKRDGNSRCGL